MLDSAHFGVSGPSAMLTHVHTHQDAWPGAAQLQEPEDQLGALLRRVMAEQGIDAAEIHAGDAAVAACLRAAAQAHATLQEAHARLARWQGAADADDRDGGGAGGSGSELTPRAGDDPRGRSSPWGRTPPSSGKRKRAPHAGDLPGDLPPAAAAAAAAAALPPHEKGLKHFSLKVAEKVEAKGATNYNAVADELVAEMAEAAAAGGGGEGAHDEKNIRRRVYDALNVLEAVGMVEKGKKDVRWLGWPPTCAAAGGGGAGAGGGSARERLAAERARAAARLQAKAAAAADATAKAFCLGNLALRNRDAPLPALLAAQEAGLPAPNPLALPFMLVAAPGEATVDVEVSQDERTARLDFHHWPITIFDDERVMRAMGLGEPRPELEAAAAVEGGALAQASTPRFYAQQQQQQHQRPPHQEQQDLTPVKAAAEALHNSLSILSPGAAAAAAAAGEQRRQQQAGGLQGPFPS